MRLILVNPNTSSMTTEAMLALARGAAPAGMSIDGMTVPFGASLITDEAALATATEAVVALGPTLADAAVDGVIVAAFGDPGLARLRRTLACPVTGLAEAGMAEAARGGRPFAIVTTTPDLAVSIRQMAEAYGHGDVFRGVRLTDEDPRLLMSDAGRLTEALRTACLCAIRETGAQAIVVGGGPLAVAARALKRNFEVPIIEPILAAVRLAVARANRVDQNRPLGR
jgi:Asp/Glu/hydantoin racemase